jgi:putative transposase
MPKSRRIIHVVQAPAVLEAFVEVVRRRLPLAFEGTRITPEVAIQVLGYASVNRMTIEASCTQLADGPSGNRLREVLMDALPKPNVLQRQLNTLLRSQLPKRMFTGKRDYEIALDITQIPYHGQPQEREDEVMRGAAKSGTTHFHGYVTVSVVHSHRRYVLAVLFAQLHDTMDDLVKRGLALVKRLKIRIRRVLLDAGFSAIEVFRALDRRGLSYIVPLKVRGKSGGVRTLFRGRRSYRTTYTLNSPQHGCYTIKAVVVRRYTRQRFKRKGARWFAYAVAGLPHTVPCRVVFEWYRHRFGIESSYRQMNQVRARTSSRSPSLRLLLIGLALILVNLYVLLRAMLSNNPIRSRVWLSLQRMTAFIARAIEALFGCAPVFQRRALNLVS